GEHSQMKIVQFNFLSNKGIQFTKFLSSSIEGNLDSLMISVPADPEECLEPVHDIKPSKQQKMDELSTLINIIDLPESQYNEDNDIIDSNKNKILKPDNHPNSYNSPKILVYSELQSPLKNSAKANLPPYINTTKKIQHLVEK
ncbi:30266_t:CDS:2, partial [Gigaspora margarita]